MGFGESWGLGCSLHTNARTPRQSYPTLVNARNDRQKTSHVPHDERYAKTCAVGMDGESLDVQFKIISLTSLDFYVHTVAEPTMSEHQPTEQLKGQPPVSTCAGDLCSHISTT